MEHQVAPSRSRTAQGSQTADVRAPRTMQSSKSNSLLLAILSASFLAVAGGCASFTKHREWPAPRQSAPDRPWNRSADQEDTIAPKLARAELVYASAIEAMQCNDPTCVDLFYQSALMVWRCWNKQPQAIHCVHSRAAELYRSSIIGLVHEGQRLQRFDPRRGLRVHIHGEWLEIPMQYYGFPWTADDFNELEIVGDYDIKDLKCVYRSTGLGVPAVATRLRCQKEGFLSKTTSFPATIILRSTADSLLERDANAVLEVYDPLRVPTVSVGDQAVPLASDKSAHLAKSLSKESRNYLQAFLQPGIVTPDERGLMMLEPYQPGKIPVVLVHGLLSDQLTWANLVNEVSARPDLLERYQLWAFQYPTGEAFLRSAASLRMDLETLRLQLDPAGTDPALQQTVLIGHSMGGLISKMQIASSGDKIWRAYANRPFEEVVMDGFIRQRLQTAAFFEPSPMVSRVIFIGTPHRGSVIAQRTLGRVASLMVQVRPEMAIEHKRLIENNPGTFSDEFARRIPTSIDLLEPTSPSLAVMDQLPLKPDVEIHSIIGRGSWMPGSGESDGVVPISSAHFPAASSEKFVDEKHSRLTSDEHVLEEVLAILRSHACTMTGTLTE